VIARQRAANAALLDVARHEVHGSWVDCYKLALLMLALAAIPLFYLNIWLGLAATIAIYGLLVRLANRAFDRQARKTISPVSRRRKQ
jgi:hypothetical protein